MASDKTTVVEYLWDVLLSDGGRRTVSFDDLSKAIRHCNDNRGTSLSPNNPANFLKDLLRGSNPSRNWPQRLADMRITAKQAKGENRVFEFIDYAVNQSEPFPNPFEIGLEEAPLTLQSVSLPLTSKSLGRTDESWLVQVAVHLRVLEAHFVNRSKLDIREVTHLQVGVKLGKSEVDSLYLAIVQTEKGERVNALVTCEAKQSKDPIIADQIVEQIVSASSSVEKLDLGVKLVIPVAIKAVAKEGAITVFEFEPWTIADAAVVEGERKELRLAASGFYKLKPPVPGVGHIEKLKSRSPRSPRI